jgi:hypothetical protein
MTTTPKQNLFINDARFVGVLIFSFVILGGFVISEKLKEQDDHKTAIGHIKEQLIEISFKLSQISQNMEDKNADMKDKIKDHEQRIKALEAKVR